MRCLPLDPPGPRRSGLGLLALSLLVTFSGLTVPGCRADLVRPATPADLAAALRWTLTAAAQPDPGDGDGGLYELAYSNPGRAAVSLDGFEVYLSGPWGQEGALGEEAAPVPLIGTVPGGESGSVVVGLSTRALWPDLFTVRSFVRSTSGEGKPVEVARGTFSPGSIALVPVWPERGYVDFPVDDYLVLKFSSPVDLDSLAACLSLRVGARPDDEGDEEGPSVAVDVRRDQNGVPGVYEIWPRGGLGPFTRYVLTIGGQLEAEGGATRMGRSRGLTFSTGAPASIYEPEWFPSWSPDGTRVAWTAPGSDGRTSLWVGAVADMLAEVKVAGVEGGTPAWSADGAAIYFSSPSGRGSSVHRLELAGKKVVPVIAAERLKGAGPLRLATSPDGAYLAIEACLGGMDAHSDVLQSVYVCGLRSGQLTELPGEGLTSVLVGWVSGRVLYAATFEDFDHSHHFRYNLYRWDPVTGQRETLLGSGELENVGGYSIATQTAHPLLAYWTWEAQSTGRWILHRPTGLKLVEHLDQLPAALPLDYPLPAGMGGCRQAALSPFAGLVAVAVPVDGSWDIAVGGVPGWIKRPAAWSAAAEFAPAWSPDGTWLAYFEASGPPEPGLGPSLRVKIVDPSEGNGVAFSQP